MQDVERPYIKNSRDLLQPNQIAYTTYYIEQILHQFRQTTWKLKLPYTNLRKVHWSQNSMISTQVKRSWGW